jgi:hypothetical protein
VFQEYLHQDELGYGFVITGPVMAFTKVSASGKDAVGPVYEAGQQKGRLDPASAHHPDGSDMGRVLQPADAGRIRSRITAPVTQET